MWFRDPEVSFRLKGTPSGMDQPTHFSSLEFAQVSGTQISGPSLLSFVLLRWYQQQTQNNTYLVWLLRWQDSPLYQPSIHSQPSKNTKHRAQYYMQPPVEEPWWILEAWPPWPGWIWLLPVFYALGHPQGVRKPGYSPPTGFPPFGSSEAGGVRRFLKSWQCWRSELYASLFWKEQDPERAT